MNELFSMNGIFTLPSGEEMHGRLSLDGSNSELDLWSRGAVGQYSDRSHAEGLTSLITGTLDDERKVSLIDCLGLGRRGRFGAEHYSSHDRFFPHYAIVGGVPFEGEIASASFVTDDTNVLFYDRKSFGELFSEDKLRELLNDKGLSIDEEWHPVAKYWTGRREIVSGETPLGNFSACNQPSWSLGGGPDGANIKNRVVLSLRFPAPVTIYGLNDSIRTVLRFFEILVGRPQKILHLTILTNYDDERPSPSLAYINMFRDRSDEDAQRQVDWRDTLIDSASEPNECLRLLSAWLERDKVWRLARTRFSAGWQHQNSYNADRLVGAANAFDLLPKDEFPSSTETLKQRVRHRAQLFTGIFGNALPEIDFVINSAVDLRHLWVHGAEEKPKRQRLVTSCSFLTDTLEFVFCISDLVELGWDLSSWVRQNHLGYHRFLQYFHNYSYELAELKKRWSGSP